MPEASSPTADKQSVVSLSLAPQAGFCVKTTTLEGAKLPASNGKPAASTAIPAGLKVFINIAWDVNAPPSPRCSEEAIERVLSGEESDVEEESVGGLYIPAVVSPPREDRDKAGNPSLVFDCIYNTTVKTRISGNEEYKAFIVELALQRIEGQTGLILSRDIRTPNIASKGKILPCTVKVPASLLLETPTAAQPATGSKSTSNEQETPDEATSSHLLGAAEANEVKKTEEEGHEAFSLAILEMLKALPTTEPESPVREPSPVSSSRNLPQDEVISSVISTVVDSETRTDEVKVNPPNAGAPRWTWRKEDSGRLRIEVEIPELTAELARNSTLDVEPRRLVLCVPHRDPLDIDLALADADIKKHWIGGGASAVVAGESPEDRIASSIQNALTLKRKRDLDVDGAEAEWRVGSGVVVIRL